MVFAPCKKRRMLEATLGQQEPLEQNREHARFRKDSTYRVQDVVP